MSKLYSSFIDEVMDIVNNINVNNTDNDYILNKAVRALDHIVEEIEKIKRPMKFDWFTNLILSSEDKYIILLSNEIEYMQNYLECTANLKNRYKEVKDIIVHQESKIKDLTEKNRTLSSVINLMKDKDFAESNIEFINKRNEIQQSFVWRGLRLKALKQGVDKAKEMLLIADSYLVTEKAYQTHLSDLKSSKEEYFNKNRVDDSISLKIKIWIYIFKYEWLIRIFVLIAIIWQGIYFYTKHSEFFKSNIGLLFVVISLQLLLLFLIGLIHRKFKSFISKNQYGLLMKKNKY
jgi:ABC-type multidrug transport system fused ATPase/permease subunit